MTSHALETRADAAHANPRPTAEVGRPAAASPRVRFALVVPALNEEEAIGPTLERALAAREEVVANTPVDEMIVVFVNDGSTDGTQAIADRYPDVVKIRFDRNQGYGAAIKAGFLATDAELVGFIDADGTCDPRFCTQLINHLYETGADIALGARLNPDSRMPFLRRLGNRLFARLIGLVSGHSLTDAASGMRVIRRDSLRKMVPLPDGLHFTPAMSCTAELDPRLRIEEVPMPYRERVGRSKLRVITDGLRFLAIILFAVSCYNPIASLASLGLLFCLIGAPLWLIALALGASVPVVTILAGAFLFVFLQSVFIGMLCHQLNFLLIGPRRVPGRLARLMDRLLWTRPMVLAGAVILACGIVLWAAACLVSSPWRAYLWIAAAMCVAVAGWTALGGVILRVIWATRERQRALWDDPFAPRAGIRGSDPSRDECHPTVPPRDG